MILGYVHRVVRSCPASRCTSWWSTRASKLIHLRPVAVLNRVMEQWRVNLESTERQAATSWDDVRKIAAADFNYSYALIVRKCFGGGLQTPVYGCSFVWMLNIYSST